MTEDGNYFIGASMDFSSNDHAIYKWSGPDVDKNALRTVQYNSHWVSQPDFVGSFETKDFVYFLFREPAVEYMNCGKAVYSRIARVCKSDRGGTHILKDSWTTFLKARLNCSVPGNYPFYYDEIQSMSYLESAGVVYATFSTTENSIPATAVCSFNISSIENAFAGPFKYQDRPDSTWTAVKESSNHYQCQDKPDNDGLLIARKYQLMDTSVQGTTSGPVYLENLNRFKYIAVDAVPTKHQDTPAIHVIFIATDNSTIRKLSFNPRSGETCLVEVLQPFPTGSRTNMRQMKLLDKTGSLYISTEEAVLRIPVQRCHRFKTKKECLNAMDPYCGWNRNKDECTPAPNHNPRAGYWQQNVISCPVTTDPVDGGWSEWSNWDQCAYSNPDKRVESGGDYCMCRRRGCDNPAPANGGAGCEGAGLVVTNCTQHGQWTAWSEWSGCSQSCGVGLKTRQRHCGNPEPAFGGRVCVGRDREESYCDDLPPCPGQRASSLLLTDDGESELSSTWSQWSDWTACSARCGSGFKSRGRKCYGLRCSGCDREWAECENSACSDYMDVTDWTPWINTTVVEESGGWYEKRFTFTYRTPVAISKAGRIGDERRYCYGPGRCTTIGGGAGTSVTSPEAFTSWSACSRECGGGKQFKLRVCPPGQDDCIGNSLLEQECNTQPCPGTWGCWSAWSRCSSQGRRSRTRQCESPTGGEADCLQNSGDESFEEEDCSLDSPQLRNMDGTDRELLPVSATVSINMVIGACVCGFLVGSSLAALLVYYYFKYRKSASDPAAGAAGGCVASPHYISAKSQNLYVSLPMLDLKHKQLGGSNSGPGSCSTDSNYSGTLRSNATGTLRSKAGSSVYGNSKPGEYETATIKRSHSRRDSSLITSGGAAIRADLDSEQLFS